MNLLDIVTKGSTDRSVVLRIIDETTGIPETGVVFNTSGIALWYRREGAAKTDITEATLAALTTAHTDGGFLHIADGEYRLDLPDAAFATGANYVDVGGAVTGMIVIGGRVRLVDYSLEDSVRMGMTALPNAAAEAAGGLYTRGSGVGQINQTNNGQIDANAARTGGTTNTGRDIGASVLLSSGTGTGQVSLSSGLVSLAASQSGVTIGTVTTLTNAPSDSAGVTTLLSRIPSGIFTGMTSLAQWLGLIAGKQTGNSTARTELRATGAGSGTFDETTDSQEAIRDNMGTAQTGDTFARLGAPVGASIAADIAAIEAQTDDIGAAGAGLTAIPWNAAWDAEVQSEVADALAVYDPPTNTEMEARTLVAASYATAANLATVAGYLDTEMAAVKAVTDKLDTALEVDSAVYRFTTNALEQAPTGGSAPTAADIADAVWEEAIADHSGTAGSTAEALNAAGSAGDPWVTALPGAYGAGSAGKIIGDNLNATVSSRATPAQVATELGTYDAPTKAELDAAVAPLATAANLATVAGYIDTEVATIITTLGSPAGASVSADIAAVKTQTAAIETDTQDLQTQVGTAGAGLTALGDTRVANLDATVSSRLAASGYTAPPSAATNASAVRTELTTELGRIDAAVSTRATPAQVNAEVVDALSTDTYAEPSSVPAATSSLKDKIGWLFTLGRNKVTQTATTQTVRNDADSGNVGTSTVSDDATTFTKGKWN